MKTRTGLIITIVTVASLFMASTASWAGSKQQHRWEGVAIGLGAAIIGSAIINHHAYGYHGGPPAGMSFVYRETRTYPASHHKQVNRHHNKHANHWRYPDRGPHYRGSCRQERKHGYGHRKNWNAHDRRASSSRGGANRERRR